MSRLKWMALGVTLAAALAGSAGCGYPVFTFNGAGGGDGAVASSSSGSAPGGCQVLHDTADCGPSGKCTVVDDSTGALGCVPVSSQPLLPFDACATDHECPAGTWCNLLTSVCSPFCQNNADCTPGTCIGAVDGNDAPLPGVKVCTAYCDPVLAEPCGTGATCVYDPDNGQFDCASSTFDPQGSNCQQSSDCGRGLVCAADTNSSSCLYWCEPAGDISEDCLGSYCNPFAGSPITYDGATYGYCNN